MEKKDSKTTATTTVLTEQLRINFTSNGLELKTIFNTMQSDIAVKKRSILWLLPKPKGRIVKSGKMRQCTRQSVALDIPKKSKTMVDCFFITVV